MSAPINRAPAMYPVPDPSSEPSLHRAAVLVRASGAKLTAPRVRVLACLIEADHALGHHDVMQRLADGGRIDRATIYRVLDWLAGRRLAHRFLGDDRVWRFTAEAGSDHPHPHFQCSRCEAVVCLADAGLDLAVPLPPGYRPERVQLTVTGLCPACS